MTESVRWQCQSIACLHRERWWVSAEGVIQCLNCRPPASPSLIVAQGHAAEAPEVDPDANNVVKGWKRQVAVDYGAMGPPLWILRRRTPEQVEAREGRRNVDIPADATKGCREGDQRWRDIEAMKAERGFASATKGEAP